MKQRIFTWVVILLALVCTSCSKDEATTYTVANNSIAYFTAFIHECNDADETINIVNKGLSVGSMELITANPNAVKVKIYFEELESWCQQVFYLKAGSNTDININGKTIVGPYKP